MQKQCTKGDLLSWSNEIHNWGNSVIKILLETKIRDFDKRNGIRIQSIREGYIAIDMKHFLYEKKDNAFHKVYEGEGDKRTPVLTGLTTEEEYQKIITDYLAEKTTYE